MPKPLGMPISDFIQVSTEEVAEPIRHTLDVLDQIHGLDNSVIKVPFKLVDQLGSEHPAAYYPDSKCILMMSSYRNKIMGTIEEVFHAIDFNMIFRGSHSAEQDRALKAWYKSIAESDTIRKLSGLKPGQSRKIPLLNGGTDDFVVQEDKLAWAKAGQEITARAYIQYVSSVTTDERVANESYILRNSTWSEAYCLYWDDPEFFKIGEAFTIFLKLKEWME